MRSSASKVIIAIAAAVVIIAAVVIGVNRSKTTTTAAGGATSSSTGMVSADATASDVVREAHPSAINESNAGPVTVSAGTTHIPSAPAPATCPTDPKPIENPTTFEVLGSGQVLKLVGLGLDNQNAAAAPPPNEGYTIGWYTGGPLVGSHEGKVTLTSHTFQFGGAFGNELTNGAWDNGAIIRMSDSAGNAACYRYTGSTHILVDDYDPNSDIIYDYDGKPQFALVVCSDYTPTGDTRGRLIYYGDLITG